jgi:hypothetical protein
MRHGGGESAALKNHRIIKAKIPPIAPPLYCTNFEPPTLCEDAV